MDAIPFLPGNPEDYRLLREWLVSADFTPAGICARAEVPSIFGFPTRADGRTTVSEAHDTLDLLIGLFLDGARIALPVLRRLIPDDALGVLERLGLVGAVHADPNERAATVSLYPLETLYVASDLSKRRAGVYREEELEPPDFVFSAITTLTGTFLENIPTTPCARLLELCSGTAAPALLRASTAGHAWAVDITERSTRFAEFNARLNGVQNFTALQGDLYQPVRGMTFDRIVAHPPYVPAPERAMIYRDGGPDGEDILRGIMAGLHEHLTPGGCFHATFRTTDRAGAPLEARLRAMLGEQETEFDLVLLTHYELTPVEYYAHAVVGGLLPFSVLEDRQRMYRRLEAERIVYASIVLQRHEQPREAFTYRRARGAQAGWRESEFLRWWGTRARTDEWRAVLAESHPVLSPTARLDMHYGVQAGDWAIRSCEVRSEHPFPRTVKVSHSMAMLLTACDGSVTARGLLARLRASSAIPADMPDEVILEWVREMVLEGVLEVEVGPRPTSEASAGEGARPNDLIEAARPGA
ncbi:MAG TPA: methyltransferase [Longimicrobiales bacterium]